jgi:hypothetical protein
MYGMKVALERSLAAHGYGFAAGDNRAIIAPPCGAVQPSTIALAEVVKQSELKPDEARVREMIQEMASAYQEPEQVVAWYYKNDQQLNEVRSVVLEEQVVDTVLQKANVTDKPVSYEEAVKPAEAAQAA